MKFTGEKFVSKYHNKSFSFVLVCCCCEFHRLIKIVSVKYVEIYSVFVNVALKKYRDTLNANVGVICFKIGQFSHKTGTDNNYSSRRALPSFRRKSEKKIVPVRHPPQNCTFF